MAIQASESIVGFPFCGESNGNQDLMLMNLMMESNSYGLNHHQQHQNQFDQFVNQNQNQRLVFDNSGGGNQMLFQQQMPIPIPVQVEKQRQEIDHYLRSQVLFLMSFLFVFSSLKFCSLLNSDLVFLILIVLE